MLHHHGTQDYNVAASAAATAARHLMEKKIETGVQSAKALWERIHSSVPTDAIVRGRGLKFGYGLTPEDAPLTVEAGGSAMTVHRHALGQIAVKAGIPGNYISELVTAPETWKRELAARTLGDFFGRNAVEQREDLSTSRHLVRAVNGEVRGFLSDKYRRLDSRPLLEAFAEGC